MSFQEAVCQWAWNYGSTCPNHAWILSDYDTWERNPHYSGPPVRHPEAEPEDDQTNAPAGWNGSWGPKTADPLDDIPF